MNDSRRNASHSFRHIALITLLCLSTASGLPSESYSADMNIADISAKITLPSVDYRAIPDHPKVYPALFQAKEKKSTDLNAFTKWSAMFERLDTQLAQKTPPPALKAMRERLSHYRGQSVRTMAAQVNTMMNEKRYIIDSENWGQSDYWATPIEFMERGGDCEDFAIAKYVALRTLGVPESRLRIAVVQDLKKDMPHAILIVYAPEGVYVLDNQIKEMRNANSIKHYKPIFSINQNAWWLHTTPDTSSNTIVASAE